MADKSSVSKAKFLDCTIDEYFADPCEVPSLSASIAHTLIEKSPLHAWLEHPKLGNQKKQATKDMDRGSLIHRLMLDKGKDIVVVAADSWRTKEAQTQRAMAREKGLIPVLEEDFDDAINTANILKVKLAEFEIELNDKSELPFIWYEGDTVCRGMLDHYIESECTVFDLKTTVSAHPRAVQSSMVRYGADIQWCAYTNGLIQMYPDLEEKLQFVFLYCEVEPPYAILPVIPTGTMRELGRRRWNHAVDLWTECLKTDHWPGYAQQVYYIDAPSWALNNEVMYAAESF